MNQRELAWAAGLFEGEGTIGRYACGPKAPQPYPRVQLRMTDEDSVRRFHAAVGIGKVGGPYQNGGHQEVWHWYAYGFEKTQAVVAMLWFGLGARRRNKAAEVLAG